ncbi:MAG TPA: hypothetical protein VKQ36_16620 [Ktedonobacterales bacterium]|nr:hypothetical protein [Ktedonobacterales bacterium]
MKLPGNLLQTMVLGVGDFQDMAHEIVSFWLATYFGGGILTCAGEDQQQASLLMQ